MKNELPNFLKKTGTYSDEDKENVLPGNNVSASFGPDSYVVLEEVSETENNNTNNIKDKYDHLDILNDNKNSRSSEKIMKGGIHPTERVHNSTKAKNSKTNRPFKDWRK